MRIPRWVWMIGVSALLVAHTGWQLWEVAQSPYPERYDYDEGVYAATAAADARLYTDVFLSQPPLLIDVLRTAYRAFGVSLAAARDTVVLFSLLWLLALVAIPAAAGRARAGLVAACALLGSTAFLTAAHTVQMEAPSEGLAAVSVALAVLGARCPGIVWWVASGAAAGLAVATKLTAATCAVPLIGAALTTPSAGALPSPAPRGWRIVALGAGALLAAAPFLPQVATRAGLTQVVLFHVSLARRLGVDPAAHWVLARDFLASGWPLVCGAVAGVALALLTRDWLARLVVAWLASASVLVMTLTPFWPHHLVLVLSPLALLAGVGADHVASRLPRTVVPSAAVAAAFALAVYVGAALPAASSGSSIALRTMSGTIATALPSTGEVLTDDPMVPFLARRPVIPDFIDTSVARFLAGALSLSALTAAVRDGRAQAVLVWRGTFRRQAPALEPEAAALLPIREDAGEGRVLFLRRAPPQVGPPPP